MKVVEQRTCYDIIMKWIVECCHRLKQRLCRFRKEHFLAYIIGLYIFIVLIFTTVNWVLFMMNSTSFLISDQLNKHVERYEFIVPDIDLAAYHQNAKDMMPITISEFSDMLKPDFERLQATNDSLGEKKDEFERCKEEWEALSIIVLEKRSDSIKVFREKLLSVWQQSIDSLKSLMQGQDSIEMILAGKYVELANLQYEYAKRNAEVQQIINRNYGFFIPDSLAHKIRGYNERYIWLSIEVQELEMTRRNATSRIRDLTAAFHRNRMESVTWWDFLYYSICTSTTVSFGDIAPNNGTTRFVAIFELLICLVLVGAIVDRIIKRRGE